MRRSRSILQWLMTKGGMVAFFLGCAWSFQVQGATLKGKVSFDGSLPKSYKSEIKATDDCVALGHTPVNESFLLGEDDKSLMNVVVSIVSESLAPSEAPQERVVIDQDGCVYKPRVVALQTGQKLVIKNTDGIMHNVNGKTKNNPKFNESMTKTSGDIEKIFENKEEDPFRVSCNVHPWMRGWVAVFDHDKFDVTAEDGMFEIKGLEPGEYQVKFWHERFLPQVKTVTITGEETMLDMAFDPSMAGKKKKKKKKKK